MFQKTRLCSNWPSPLARVLATSLLGAVTNAMEKGVPLLELLEPMLLANSDMRIPDQGKDLNKGVLVEMSMDSRIPEKKKRSSLNMYGAGCPMFTFLCPSILLHSPASVSHCYEVIFASFAHLFSASFQQSGFSIKQLTPFEPVKLIQLSSEVVQEYYLFFNWSNFFYPIFFYFGHFSHIIYFPK